MEGSWLLGPGKDGAGRSLGRGSVRAEGTGRAKALRLEGSACSKNSIQANVTAASMSEEECRRK
jgi:hypothetical protein